MTGKDVLPAKELPEKAATMKIWIFAFRQTIKSKSWPANKQYQKLDNTYKSDKIIEKEKPTLKKYNRSNLIYDRKYSFYPYCNIKNFNSLSLLSIYPVLFLFYSELNRFNSLNQRKGHM